MKPRHLRTLLVAVVLVAAIAAASCGGSRTAALFQPSDGCAGCHNGLRSPSGEDVSIQREWAPTMMANAARDPYWQASVRREIADRGDRQAAIEDECSICHMPMTTFPARTAGGRGAAFVRLQPGDDVTAHRLATDGVSCTVCHQVTRDRLGSAESFGGNFAIDTRSTSPRLAFGRFPIDEVRAQIMNTGSGFTPTLAQQIGQSEMCATCHTLFTGGDRSRPGLPEQVPFLEWQQSAFPGAQSCQSCHLPRVAAPTPISSVVSIPRPDFARHSFLGGNFFMARVLAVNSATTGVTSPVARLTAHADETTAYLQRNSARVAVEDGRADDSRAVFAVKVEVLAGHKLPTAYPSRRAWLHVTVRDARARVVFESGAVRPNGTIEGNDNDADAGRFEPHYAEVTRGDQVQIYESIMVDGQSRVTTALLSGVAYVKDNRLLPKGFDKPGASPETAVRGEALEDADFAGGGDRVRYAVALPAGARAPFVVDAELRYQPIGYRWAENLRRYRAAEPSRFVSYYDALAAESSIVLAHAKTTLRLP